MRDIMNRFSINCHSSIRYNDGIMVIWFDPFRVEELPHNAGLVFITHEHYDHFSPQDIRRVLSPDGLIVLPDTCYCKALEAGFDESMLLPVHTGVTYELLGLSFHAVPAYNEGKPFHPEANRWLGYVVTAADGLCFYVAGDTDNTVEARSVRCDAAFLPAGGTYTMTAQEAAALANAIRPKVAIPTHYGCIVGEMADGDVFAAGLDAGIQCVKLI